MSTHKNFDRVCIAVLILSLLVTALFMNGAAFGVESALNTRGYEERIFDTSRVHTLAIVIDDWEGFLENCENEEYAACSVVIDNESYKNVGLRAKGNTSLSTVRSLNSQRYSLKLEFDHYENGKTYHGLDKLCLNNIIQDNTYMKDYLTYRMMDEFGAVTPLCSYVWITVNGEDWGLYLAVEGLEDAFLQRNYGADYGDLYKPDTMSFGGGGPGRGRDFRMSEFMEEFNAAKGETDGDTDSATNADSSAIDGGNSASNATDSGNSASNATDSASGATGGRSSSRRGGRFSGGGRPDFGNMSGMPNFGDAGGMPDFSGMTPPDGMQFPFSSDGSDPTGGFGDMPFPGFGNNNSGERRGFGGMPGMGSDDVKLKYSDDDPDSYSSIFGNAKTVVTEADKARLIASLKALGERENLESVVDIDAVLRYFVVHNYVVNGDSYTGGMIHNYYLYEKDGQLSMLPWDYNLAFGGFQGGSATGSVNDPIDTPLSVSVNGDRPMAEWFLQQDEYTERYHQYFREFLETVDASAIIDDAYALIASYVKSDPTTFLSDYESFEKGVATLREFCELRKESVAGQLDGVIPSTDEGQEADDSALIDASGLTISDMGSMGFGGGGRGGRSGRNAESGDANASETSETLEGAATDNPASGKAATASPDDNQPDAALAGETNVPQTPPAQTDGTDAAQADGTSIPQPPSMQTDGTNVPQTPPAQTDGTNVPQPDATSQPDAAPAEETDAGQSGETSADGTDAAQTDESNAMQFPDGMSGNFPDWGGGFPGSGNGFPGGGGGFGGPDGSSGGFGPPSGDFGGFGDSQSGAASLDRFSTETWVLLGVSVAVLLAGLAIARSYGSFRKRKA